MPRRFIALATTPAVLDAQTAAYGRARPLAEPTDHDRLGPDESAFIAARDSFYLASVTERGWPYVQHRGGPPGFLHVLAPTTLAFADYTGNRQLLSTGNTAADGRVALFLMDYPNQTRLKILGHARTVSAREDPTLVEQVARPAPASQVERVFVIEVVAFDWNCPKYITPRYTAKEMEPIVAPLLQRIAALEGESR